MPPPRRQSVSMHCFINTDYAGNTVTRRSQTGLLLFVNCAPIVWFSKWQNTIEASMYSSEFITMKTAIEQIESLCYKLRMFSIPVEDPMNVFCDNESIFKNTTIPDSSICYHQSREPVASGTMQVAKEGMATNLADLITKSLAETRQAFLLE